MTRYSSGPEQTKKQRHWQAHVKAQGGSGLSRAEYCRQHKLSYYALTYWQRKKSGTQQPGTTLVPVPLERMLHKPTQSKSSGLKILVTSKLSVEVGDHFSSTTLKRVLSVLENR